MPNRTGPFLHRMRCLGPVHPRAPRPSRRHRTRHRSLRQRRPSPPWHCLGSVHPRAPRPSYRPRMQFPPLHRTRHRSLRRQRPSRTLVEPCTAHSFGNPRPRRMKLDSCRCYLHRRAAPGSRTEARIHRRPRDGNPGPCCILQRGQGRRRVTPMRRRSADPSPSPDHRKACSGGARNRQHADLSRGCKRLGPENGCPDQRR
jgi:hypothetical protein